MTQLPPPATGTELYLAAIHEELRALRVAFVDGLPGLVAGHVTAAVDQALGHVADAAPTRTEITAGTTAETPSRRTRTRTPRG